MSKEVKNLLHIPPTLWRHKFNTLKSYTIMTTFINEIEKAFNTSVEIRDHYYNKYMKILIFYVGGHEVWCFFQIPFKMEYTKADDYSCNIIIETPELKIKSRSSLNHAATTKELAKKAIKYLSKYNA